MIYYNALKNNKQIVTIDSDNNIKLVFVITTTREF